MIYYLFINSVAYRVQVIFLSIFLFFLATDASPQSVSLLSDEIIIFFKDVNYRNYAQEDGNPTTDQGVRDYLDTVYI